MSQEHIDLGNTRRQIGCPSICHASALDTSTYALHQYHTGATIYCTTLLCLSAHSRPRRPSAPGGAVRGFQSRPGDTQCRRGLPRREQEEAARTAESARLCGFVWRLRWRWEPARWICGVSQWRSALTHCWDGMGAYIYIGLMCAALRWATQGIGGPFWPWLWERGEFLARHFSPERLNVLGESRCGGYECLSRRRRFLRRRCLPEAAQFCSA